MTVMLQFGDASAVVLTLAGAGALLLIVAATQWGTRQRRRFLRRGNGEPSPSTSTVQRGSAILRTFLIVGAVAALGLAVARPQLGTHELDLERQGAAAAIVLDVSLSMGAEDIAPSRLAAAQSEIGRLLDRLQGQQVGLVIFAGSAFIRFPLTHDLAAARAIIDALEPGEALVDPGTNVAAAIDAARDLLARADASTKTILLISDGESLQGDALAAVQGAARDGIRMDAAGVGMETGATIPVIDPRTGNRVQKIDASTGKLVVTRLDPEALASLAAMGNGSFLRLGQPGDLAGIASIWAALDASVLAAETDRLPIEQYQIVAGVALALLLLHPLVPPFRTPRRAQPAAIAATAVLAAFLLAACADSIHDQTEKGIRLQAAGDHRTALDAYRAAQAQDPADARLAINVGRALHALEQYDRAVTESARALRTNDPVVRARAWYQIGAHQLALGNPAAARDAYIEALRDDPADLDSKFNLEFVLRQLMPDPSSSTASSQTKTENAGSRAPSDNPDSPSDDPGTNPAETPPLSGDAPDNLPGDQQQETGAREGANEGTSSMEPSESREEAQAALAAALEALDLDAPTSEQALAILDALRLRRTLAPLGAGADRIPVEGDADY